jgi:hypothetical protein
LVEAPSNNRVGMILGHPRVSANIPEAITLSQLAQQ